MKTLFSSGCNNLQLNGQGYRTVSCILYLVSRCLGLLLSVWLAVASGSLLAADSDEVQRLADRAAVYEVAMRYIEALDTRDADMYVGVFTDDAVYDIEGQIVQGHDALRAIVTGLQASRDRAVAEGRPVVDLYHSNLNPQIEILSTTTATYRAYWQTLRLGDDKAMRIGGMGLIEDEMVKVDGAWKIKKRVLTNFVPRN